MKQAGYMASRLMLKGYLARIKVLLILLLVFCFLGIQEVGDARAAQAPSDTQAEIAELITKSRKKRKEAALSLARRGDPMLLSLLLALREGSLYAWKPSGGGIKVVIGGDVLKKGDEEFVPLFEAYSKAPLKDSSGKPLLIPTSQLQEIRAGRRIRRAIRPYISRLKNSAQLLSPDPNVRRAAATRMARLGDPKLIPILRKSAASESHWLSRNALEAAIALIEMKDADAKIRQAAAKKLGEIKALNAVGDLKTAAGLADGNKGDAVPAVRAEAKNAVNEIEYYQSWTSFIDTLFRGMSLGSILLLMALGLAIVFGLMGVINMAHGELMMIGAYATFVVQGLFISYLPENLFGFYFIMALPAAFAAAALVGYLMEVSIIRHLYGRPLETLLTTWGISLVLQQAVRQVFGAQNVDVKAPSWLSGGYHLMIGVQFPYNRLFIVLLALVCVVGTYTFLFRTWAGMRIRAVTQNREMSTCLGVSSRRVDAWTFAFGAGLAGLAGAALSQVGNVGPDLGQNYIVDSFMVVVTGGVGKLMGSIVAGLGLGGMNKLLEPAMGAVFSKVMILMLIILFLQRRPEGLFATRARGA
ncbi:MAG: urea ABC transporter permease subunit UrtB [Nitrospinaceae bacterium]|nr:urea ABC transporter permease subunit UrtB [Nitrospinaceae bacterium]MBT3432750.1 urea ABC transporter permease subunit UrtB [Nitrospinaceae bacterium]MBT3821054.1 urea ABC transporter permease subunit UrtB [Nitrospinaceae bacterium]MBT4094387.1 urea ABC transporter permease subunit UrtB [Nitrospinaceae bacterium]MBT4429827.1 urea ABC transporter permease subunit UrtB [Nitrospinaceae bacterium]